MDNNPDSRDRFEADNLIWQLDITFNKLSEICKKNAKLVDYINKKVDKTLFKWNGDKDNFKKLTWAEMDDSDLDLDLDIIIPPTPKDNKDNIDNGEDHNDDDQREVTPPPNIDTPHHDKPITPLLTSNGSPIRIEGQSSTKNNLDSFNPFDDEELSRRDDNAADADPLTDRETDIHEPENSVSHSYPGFPAIDVLNEGGITITTSNNVEQTVVALINSTIKQKDDENEEIIQSLQGKGHSKKSKKSKFKSGKKQKEKVSKKSKSKVSEKDDSSQISSSYFVQPSSSTNSDNNKKDKKRKGKKDKVGNNKNDGNWSTVSRSKKKKKMMKGKLMFVQQKLLKRKKKMEETEQKELEEAEKMKEQQRLRQQRAEKRKLEHQKMMKQKNKKLTSKLNKIKLNQNMEKVKRDNAIKQKQMRAEKKKQKIDKDKKKPSIKFDKKSTNLQKLNEKETKKAQQILDKRMNNAVINKRNQIRSRKNSLSISVSLSNDPQNNSSSQLLNQPFPPLPPKDDVNYLKIDKIGDEDIKMDETKYFDTNLLTRLSGKFLHIPRIVRKSSASDLYSQIEILYRDTNTLLSQKNSNNNNDLEGILKAWLKNTAEINFKDRKYDKDVLLVVNRLIYFDVNTLNFKCCKLFIKNMIILTKNKIGTELLSFKYVSTLLTFYKKCLNEYFYKNNQIYKSILPQLSILLVKIFQNSYIDHPNHKNDKDYKKFKKQTGSFLILNLYKSSFIIKISSLFKSICCSMNINNINLYLNQRILDGILNILIQIPLTLKKHNNINGQICALINNQIESTNCMEIIPFTYKLINYLNDSNHKKTLGVISKCFQFSTDIINSNNNNKIYFQNKIILKNKMKIYKILSLLLEHANIHFNIECDYILESIKSIFDFITFSTMNNKQIQEIYNFSFSKNQQLGITLIHRLCNVPFYFILQKQGQNVLFPALIAITYNNDKNLNLLKNSINPKHLQLWLKTNIYSDVYKDLLSFNNKNNEFITKIPSKMWSNCLHFYNV